MVCHLYAQHSTLNASLLDHTFESAYMPAKFWNLGRAAERVSYPLGRGTKKVSILREGGRKKNSPSLVSALMLALIPAGAPTQ